MSKAFTKESDGADDEPEEADALPAQTKNYVTPAGLAALQEEFRKLLYEERPKVVEIVSWAAGNGDRSENGDYIYGKKRLREIDYRVRYLTKRIESGLSLQLYDTAAALGGTFSAEHGVGRFKKHLLERYGDVGRIAAMRRIKTHFDPSDIMNAGAMVRPLGK
jgi:hypothetical protein